MYSGIVLFQAQCVPSTACPHMRIASIKASVRRERIGIHVLLSAYMILPAVLSPRLSTLEASSASGGQRQMRCFSTRFCIAILTAWSVLFLSSSTVNAAPVVHSSILQSAVELVLSDHEGLAPRMIHLTARPNSSFRLGKWSVTFFSIQLIRTLPTHLVELYDQIMQLTAPYDHAAPRHRYFEFRFGRLSLIFESTDGLSIPYDVIYAFAEQALERVLRDWTGLYRGVSAYFD